MSAPAQDGEFAAPQGPDAGSEGGAAIDLGVYTVDELAALCPGRLDLLGGSDPDVAAGTRGLITRRSVPLDPGRDDDAVAEEGDERDDEEESDGAAGDAAAAASPTPADRALAVIASFLSEPERTVLLRREDLFGTDEYVLHGQRVDGAMCYVIEGGTSGVRRMLFSANPDAIEVAAELVGLHDVTDSPDPEPAPFEFDPSALGETDPAFAAAMAEPAYLVTAGVADPDGRGPEMSFVFDADRGWVCEWWTADRATATPLHTSTVRTALERLLG